MACWLRSGMRRCAAARPRVIGSSRLERRCATSSAAFVVILPSVPWHLIARRPVRALDQPGVVGSARGAVPGLLSVRFPGRSPSEADRRRSALGWDESGDGLGAGSGRVQAGEAERGDIGYGRAVHPDGDQRRIVITALDGTSEIPGALARSIGQAPVTASIAAVSAPVTTRQIVAFYGALASGRVYARPNPGRGRTSHHPRPRTASADPRTILKRPWVPAGHDKGHRQRLRGRTRHGRPLPLRTSRSQYRRSPGRLAFPPRSPARPLGRPIPSWSGSGW